MTTTGGNMAIGVQELPWHVKFARHFRALFRKNVLINIRSIRSFFARLSAAFWFLLLLWLSDKAIQADNSQQSRFKNLREPNPERIKPIPRCESDVYYTGDECYDFIYTPVGVPVVEDLVAAIRENNPGRPIAPDQVLGLPSRRESDDYLKANTGVTQGAVHFEVQGDDVSFVLATNATRRYWKGEFVSPNTLLQLPLQVATHNAILNYHLANAGEALAAQPEVYSSEFAHPALDTSSIVSTAGGIFLYAACMFGFIILLGNVVSEREEGLRLSLQGLGMLDSAYYASWIVWEALLAVVVSLVIMVSGYIFQFKIMLDNNFFVSFFLYLLFQLALLGLAFFFAPMLRKASQAIYLGFVLFIIGWVMQLVVAFGAVYKPKYEGTAVYGIFTIFPWSVFIKGMSDLEAMTATDVKPGISWSRRSTYCNSSKESLLASGCNSQRSVCDCSLSMGQIFVALLLQWIVFTALGLYLDQVIPDENGQAQPPWFFLLPSYWRQGSIKPSDHGTAAETAGKPIEICAPTPPGEGVLAASAAQSPRRVPPSASAPGLVALDKPPAADGRVAARLGTQGVSEEEDRLRALLEVPEYNAGGCWGRRQTHHAVRKVPGDDEAGVPPVQPVEVFGLQKKFRSGFWAVRNNWFDIAEGSLFCLLGPNGAGKSTTIKALTGVIRPTGGDALICGFPLRTAGALTPIRQRIGVCPQFDVLWPRLTAYEHLELFSWIKGVRGREIKDAVASALKQVALSEAGHGQTRTYSGGMRRRLSVAIAFLGDPKVVFLDEPTTGMDPISRRQVWDIIEAAKPGRAIVLTTHSMEEADILGDRIGIMALARMRALGSSIALKRVYGSGYQLAFLLSRDRAGGGAGRANLVTYIRESLSLSPVEQTASFIKFLVPVALEGRLAGVLHEVEGSKARYGVTDVQIAMSSLEEVFLAIATQAQMEAAAETNATTKYTDPSGDMVWTIPLGAATIQHPDSGMQYAVKWTQDAQGALQVESVAPVAPPKEPAASTSSVNEVTIVQGLEG